ncbi:MAG TPA: IclR family transcriptional regulator [Casimicrobiaceae bacterium]|nr:IclR family transcriptional regulator [Casimicrobiaceae bacterium]
MSTSLTRGLRVIEVLAQGAPLGVTEIAQRTGSSKSGIHALLSALVRAGFADHAPGGAYRLGLKAWEIGRSVPAARLIEAAGPVMSELVARVHEGAVLGVLDGFEVVYVDRVESEQAVRVHAAVGDRIPAHCTSTGLALLADLDDAQVDHLLPRKLPAITPDTFVDRRTLFAELARIRTRGYAINRGGWRIDVGGIAASIPIGTPRAGVAAGLCIALPLYRMTRPWITRTAPMLVQYAARIGHALAQPGSSIAA